MILPSAIDAIGNTPLVDLTRACAALGVEGRILAKLDFLLPGFSKKDRAAKAIIQAARAEGSLTPGQPVVELTSGNMGTGLAIVCGILGHSFIAVMSRGNSVERARMMAALGAEVVLVDQAPGGSPGQVSGADLALVEDVAQRITTDRGAFRADQFGHPGNPAAHETGTGPEFWEQSGGAIQVFADFVGSGGTLAGTARFLAPKGVACYAIEPKGAEALAGGDTAHADHPIQGGGYGMPELAHMRDVPIVGTVTVTGADARDHARLLAGTEGLFAGYSAGANLAAAAKLLRGPEQGKTVGIVLCDSGLKYLSTDLWADAP